LKEEITEAGLSLEQLLSIESFGWLLPEFEKKWQEDDERKRLLGIIKTVESEEPLLGIGSHIMAIARKGK
jgi:hypothetical protein